MRRACSTIEQLAGHRYGVLKPVWAGKHGVEHIVHIPCSTLIWCLNELPHRRSCARTEHKALAKHTSPVLCLLSRLAL